MGHFHINMSSSLSRHSFSYESEWFSNERMEMIMCQTKKVVPFAINHAAQHPCSELSFSCRIPGSRHESQISLLWPSMGRQTSQAGGRGPVVCSQKRQELILSMALLPGSTAPELTRETAMWERHWERTAHSGPGWMALGPFRLARNREIPHLYPATQLEHWPQQYLYIRSSLDRFSKPDEHLNCPGFCYNADSETPGEPESLHF